MRGSKLKGQKTRGSENEKRGKKRVMTVKSDNYTAGNEK